jgi:FixJ family two-component response regulator
MAVMDELRSSGNEIPIVVMSGFSTDVITPAHRVQFLQKPFTVADLNRTVASVLESAAA